MLNVAFSEKERQLLAEFPEFTAAVQAIKSLDDFEDVCRLGGSILMAVDAEESFPRSISQNAPFLRNTRAQ